MPRITITLPNPIYNKLTSLVLDADDSMSGIINRLLGVGMNCVNEENHHSELNQPNREVEQHCHQLIIQMHALIKNMSAEMLKFTQEDFERLRQAAMGKYNDLLIANERDSNAPFS